MEKLSFRFNFVCDVSHQRARDRNVSCELGRCMWSSQTGRRYSVFPLPSLSSRVACRRRSQVVQMGPGHAKPSKSLLVRTSNKPLQDRIQVGFFFRAYAVAAHLAM